MRKFNLTRTLVSAAAAGTLAFTLAAPAGAAPVAPAAAVQPMSAGGIYEPTIPDYDHLVTVDDEGGLWLSSPTGNGFNWEKRVMGGFKGVKQLSVVSWDGPDNPLDLIATFDDGTLRFYQGHPSGGFHDPKILATGWEDTTMVVTDQWGVADSNGFRDAVIFAIDSDTGELVRWERDPQTLELTQGTVVERGFKGAELDTAFWDEDQAQDLIRRDPDGNVYVYRGDVKSAELLIDEPEPLGKISPAENNMVWMSDRPDADHPHGAVGGAIVLTTDSAGNLLYDIVQSSGKLEGSVLNGDRYPGHVLAKTL